ncbi:hypothetical protein AVEN_165274-1 [Araneus ventricosus]|uniref:Uncharacterized protein n=1 Tax=Araneus ventricosus TaxID=182803 RepID=A0A4Y2ASS6_ARAVE|nr:hypothetical protein AVEN_165274-1 [Araneus ventricosus]
MRQRSRILNLLFFFILIVVFISPVKMTTTQSILPDNHNCTYRCQEYFFPCNRWVSELDCPPGSQCCSDY